MKKVQIISYASEICWWMGYVGQVCPVLEVYEPTGFIKIRVIMTEKYFEYEPFPVEGWIPPEYIKVIE